MFWRWDLQVYMGESPADYGLISGDSTFDIIRHSAQLMKRHTVASAPSASCTADCWVAETATGVFGIGQVQRCALASCFQGHSVWLPYCIAQFAALKHVCFRLQVLGHSLRGFLEDEVEHFKANAGLWV